MAELKQGESQLFKFYSTNIGGLAYVSMAQDAGAPHAVKCTREGAAGDPIPCVSCGHLWQVSSDGTTCKVLLPQHTFECGVLYLAVMRVQMCKARVHFAKLAGVQAVCEVTLNMACP